jgi:miniconductance mechanosensitive channel
MLVASSIIGYFTLKSTVIHDNEMRLKQNIALLEHKIESVNNLDDFVQKISLITPLRITIVDTDGNVLAESETDKSTMENHANRIEIIRSATQEFGITTRYSSTLGIDFLYVAKRISYHNRVITLRLSVSLARIMDDFYLAWSRLAVVFLVFIILSLILHKDISYFITGISAFAAVLLLIFKDSILGLVAGVQLSSNKSVNIGDWIVVPKYGADGTVEEITLNFVKIRNWDKTTSVVPTYALVQDSFINWRGMEESGGRRIKRSLNIDMTSVKFLDEHLIKKLKQVEFITDYLHRKEEELKKYNETHVVNHSEPINGRRMTNLGTFRKYLEEYLSHNENIHKDMTFLIRYLQPGNNGIPIEIYIFSKVQEWAQYEAIQADIFDHILAIIPYFDLRIFQNPSGHDFSKFINQQ